jgi:glutamate N-acetyltransferase/amino-acid N-acetyltransferase
VPSTNLTFPHREAHRAWLASQAALPAGFRVGDDAFRFHSARGTEAREDDAHADRSRPATPDFAAMFTKTRFPARR